MFVCSFDIINNYSLLQVACQTADLPRIPCFAHTLQLAIADGLRLGKKPADAKEGTIQKALTKARKLVTFFNHSQPGKYYKRFITCYFSHICKSSVTILINHLSFQPRHFL